MNGIPAQVLFDSGATRSFVSLALSKKFTESSSMLDCPLEVKIVYDRSVRVTVVFQRLCSETIRGALPGRLGSHSAVWEQGDYRHGLVEPQWGSDRLCTSAGADQDSKWGRVGSLGREATARTRCIFSSES